MRKFKRRILLDAQKNSDAQKQKKVFDLILLNIKESCHDLTKTKCVKKNMYDSDLKYIAISYRWGELNEQLVKTPGYTAHITSFDLFELK
ncbi:unnamed protein product [Cunninghamella blakesleeana]